MRQEGTEQDKFTSISGHTTRAVLRIRLILTQQLNNIDNSSLPMQMLNVILLVIFTNLDK